MATASIDLSALMAEVNVTSAKCAGVAYHKPLPAPSEEAEAGAAVPEEEEVALTRAAEMKEAQTQVLISLALTRPLILERPTLSSGLSVYQLAPPKDVAAPEPPRDVEQELRDEIDAFTQAILQEYAAQFLATSQSEELSAEEKQSQLFYVLNTGGLHHKFKEQLKPRIQRVVRKRFTHKPGSTQEMDQFTARLYRFLLEQVGQVLNSRLQNIKASEVPLYTAVDEEKKHRDAVAHCAMRAANAEATERWEEAARAHEDCVNAAQVAASVMNEDIVLLEEAWSSFAGYYLRRDERDKALQCIKELISVTAQETPTFGGHLLLCASVLMEQGQAEHAWSVLDDVKMLRMPELPADADGYEVDDYAKHCPALVTAMLCMHHQTLGKAQEARQLLRYAVAAHGPAEGEPRRTAVAVMLELSSYLAEHKLWTTAAQALDVAQKCEEASAAKAMERGLTGHCPTPLRAKMRWLKSSILLAEGKATQAESLALEATELQPEASEAWSALSAAQEALGNSIEAAASGVSALVRYNEKGKTAPLPFYMRLAKLFSTLGQHDQSKDLYLSACKAHKAPSAWLGAAKAYMALEQPRQAEDSLHQSSRLYNRDPEVWGRLAQLLLSLGEKRLVEAQAALEHALALGLTDAVLLRELGTSYMAIDRLELSEIMLRRALASAEGVGTSGIRKRLGDVLSAKNATAAAVEQYRQVLLSEEAQQEERADVFKSCGELLRSLGRHEEVDELAVLAGVSVN
ncbi:unnamed protein product [Chrysoparadoxa australica]